MTIGDKITHQVQAAKANLDKLFDKAGGDGRPRTESAGQQARSAIDRAKKGLEAAFKR
ncbi:CsbD family protein [Nocardia wallacei]|uniref:CsbD family protein n=1 Tax=Nocardia TaxID=1817 RepID=UPI00245687B5|nr:CsbD family protein [Nocardia wallacei]